MSRPDDIPQRVWDAVEALPLHGDGYCDDTDLAIIARAIMAAEQREREHCAQEMDRRWRENANTPETRAAYSNAADAIRNRKETP